jgi:hypothetical protein
MNFLRRSILGFLVVPLALVSCANAPANEPGAGGATQVPGAVGGGSPGSTGGSKDPTDLIHGARCVSPLPTPASAGPDTPVSTCIDNPGGMPGVPVAQPVEPRPGMAGVAPLGWDSVDVSGDGLTLTLTFVTGVEPCSVLDHVDTEQTAQAVTITLFEGHDPDAGQVACPDIAAYKSVRVTLDEPLGDRTVKDGAEARSQG